MKKAITVSFEVSVPEPSYINHKKNKTTSKYCVLNLIETEVVGLSIKRRWPRDIRSFPALALASANFASICWYSVGSAAIERH